MLRKVESKRGSKIRFVMLEADVDDGNLSDLTHAIAAALRPPTAPQRTPIGPSPDAAKLRLTEAPAAAGGGDAEETGESDAAWDEGEANSSVSRPQPSRVSTPYRPKVNVIDVDLVGDPEPFKPFAAARNPKAVRSRFLLVAAWFKEYRSVEQITMDHVYTCFKAMDWKSVADMSDPFRKLETAGLGKYEKKLFTINHIGVDKALKRGGSEA